MITNEAILDNYEASVSCLKEYYALVKASDAVCALQKSPTVKVNKHNINNVYNGKTLLERSGSSSMASYYSNLN